jgi:hypothetical protein
MALFRTNWLVELRPGIHELRIGRPHLGFQAQSLLGTHARPRLEVRPTRVELALQSLKSRLEFILSKLGDHIVLSDILAP